MDLLTKNGHNLFDVASGLQKGIRRGNFPLAGYCANEMFGRYRKYLWRRLLTVSAEDCNDCVTKEILALSQADEAVGQDGKIAGYNRTKIFVAKAIVLLLKARKNRDADYFACNLMLSEEEVDVRILDDAKVSRFPDYVYDMHTKKGRAMGKSNEDFIVDEQEALHPKKEGLYDRSSWENDIKLHGKAVDVDSRFRQPSKEDLEALEDGVYKQMELL
jgi:replication-associated recombination protein RarA